MKRDGWRRREKVTAARRYAWRIGMGALFGTAALIVLVAALAAMAHAQDTGNTHYASQYPGSTVAAKVTAAQADCTAGIPCEIVIGANLATAAEGTLPTPCTQCLWVDFRVAGSLRVASNSSPALAAVGTGGALPGWAGAKAADNVQLADQFSGADPCAKITAAQAALPSTGGIVDGRGFQGTVATCSAGFTVGSSTKPVLLLLGAVILPVQNSVVISTGSGIVGQSPLSSGAFPTYIDATGTFPTSTPVIQFDATNVGFGIRLENVGITCSSISGCVGIDTGKAQENTLINNVFVNNYMSKCLNSTGTIAQDFQIKSLQCWAAATAPATYVGIDIAQGGGTNADLALTDISIGPSTATGTAGIRCNSCNFTAQRVHTESVTDGILFTGAGAGGVVEGMSAVTGTNAVHLASTVTGAVSLFGIRSFVTHNIVNDVSGVTGCDDGQIASYSMGTVRTPPVLSTSCSTSTTVRRICEIHIGGAGGPALLDTNDEPASCFNGFNGTLTILEVRCVSDSSTAPTIQLVRSDSTNILSAALSCSTGWQIADGLAGRPSIAATTLTAQQYLDADIVTAGGVATWLRIVITMTL